MSSSSVRRVLPGALFAVGLLLSLSGSLEAQEPAPPVLNPANGHHYEVISFTGNWSEARAAAARRMFRGYGGHLATITSAEENQFIIENLPAAYQLNAYLGGYQDTAAPGYSEPAGGWRWVTDEPWEYANWLWGEPNNVGPEHFLQYWRSVGFWNDLRDEPNGETLGMVVEYDTPSTYRISTDPSDAFIAGYYNSDEDSVEFYGTKDGAGLPAAITTARVKDSKGKVTTLVLDGRGWPMLFIASNGCVFEIQQVSELDVVLIGRTPDGAAETVRIGTPQEIFGPDTPPLPRLAGGLLDDGSVPAAVEEPAVHVSVRQCDRPVYGAAVFVTVRDLNSREELLPTLSGQTDGAGFADIGLPVNRILASKPLYLQKLPVVFDATCPAFEKIPAAVILRWCARLRHPLLVAAACGTLLSTKGYCKAREKYKSVEEAEDAAIKRAIRQTVILEITVVLPDGSTHTRFEPLTLPDGRLSRLPFELGFHHLERGVWTGQHAPRRPPGPSALFQLDFVNVLKASIQRRPGRLAIGKLHAVLGAGSVTVPVKVQLVNSNGQFTGDGSGTAGSKSVKVKLTNGRYQGCSLTGSYSIRVGRMTYAGSFALEKQD